MLETWISGVKLKNPVIAASGTFGFGKEYGQLMDLSQLGGISSKGITLEPRLGNLGERMWETPMGMLNSVGLQNPGIPAFLKEELPFMTTSGTAVIVNLSGSTEEDYVKGAALLDVDGVDIVEVNISCPNVKEGGMAFGTSPKVAAQLVAAVRQATKKPLMVKLSPNVGSIAEMAIACVEAGADSLSLINTIKGMAIDIRSRRPVFKNGHAGLSGPAIRPIALCMTYEVCQAVDVPVVGMGGIAHWQDALEFILAGASAVQVGTANFSKPTVMLDVVKGLENYCMENEIQSFEELRGAAL